MSRPPGIPRTYSNAVTLLILTVAISAVIVVACVAMFTSAGIWWALGFTTLMVLGFRDYPARIREAWQWTRFHHRVSRDLRGLE
jgi:FtsH-binding integral membrane protein